NLLPRGAASDNCRRLAAFPGPSSLRSPHPALQNNDIALHWRASRGGASVLTSPPVRDARRSHASQRRWRQSPARLTTLVPLPAPPHAQAQAPVLDSSEPRMTEARRHSVDIPLSRTLVALRRVRSLRDPDTSSLSKIAALVDNRNMEASSCGSSATFGSSNNKHDLRHKGNHHWERRRVVDLGMDGESDNNCLAPDSHNAKSALAKPSANDTRVQESCGGHMNRSYDPKCVHRCTSQLEKELDSQHGREFEQFEMIGFSSLKQTRYDALRRSYTSKGDVFMRNPGMPWAFAEAGKEKLKHGLKILVETEKQLRTSKDQSTWLTAALLQFNTGESLPPTNMNPLEAPEKVSYSRGSALCWKLYWCRASLPVEKAGTKRQQDEPRPRLVGWLWPCAAAAASEQASRETTTAEKHSPTLKQKAKRRR
ncbi:hypothetical protein GW17_00023435, partial [Ensete ventricosum]